MKMRWESRKVAYVGLCVFILAAIAVTLKLWFAAPLSIKDISFNVAAYNNFLIFKWAGFNFLNELPLYISNDPLHYDLFKYSPTCALAFVPLSWLPTGLGLLLWNLVNMILPLWALNQIIGLNKAAKNILAIWLLGEGITSLLNVQSNGLVLGLLLGSIASFQRDKNGLTVLLILLAGFIKIFGWIFFLLFLLKPKSIPKAALYGLSYGGMLVLAPLLFVNASYLISEYRWWLLLLKHDSGTYIKLSFMGWFQSWFSIVPPKNVVLFAALAIQIVPLFWLYRAAKRSGQVHTQLIQFGASLLVWVVLFNHMAESATYVIAVGGIVLFFSGEAQERRWPAWTVLTLVMLFSVLGPTDIYPKELRYWIVETAQLKAFAVLTAYVYMIWSLLRNKALA
jgi:hypothetical protein